MKLYEILGHCYGYVKDAEDVELLEAMDKAMNKRGMITPIEEVCLGQYLADYPENMDFDSIIELMEDSDFSVDGIEPTEHFEDWYLPRLAQEIMDLHWSINNL